VEGLDLHKGVDKRKRKRDWKEEEVEDFFFFSFFFSFLSSTQINNQLHLVVFFFLCSSQLIRAPKGLKDGQDISGCLPRVNLCVNRLFFQNLQEGASFPGQDVIRPLRTASVPLNIQVNVIKQEGRRKGEGVL